MMDPQSNLGNEQRANEEFKEDKHNSRDRQDPVPSSPQPSSSQDSKIANGQPIAVVGVGASAGGVEALESLFSEISETTNAAYVIVQHLSPEFDSLMHQILARRTGMKVCKIESGVRIEPNAVYVLPKGTCVRVRGDRLVTHDMAGERELNPINEFFYSLAEHCGSRAVAIVLSGTGSDGALGAVRVHQNDGLVIAQCESSSKFNGMPRATIATGITDAILSIEEMPAAISRFLEFSTNTGTKLRKAVIAEVMDCEKRILQLLHRKFSIDFDHYKRGMFGRRVERRMALSDVSGIEAYVDRLESDPDELKLLYDDLLIGVTEFFRDPKAFTELQHRILPKLIESALPTGKFRVWIAPCATGEEAYSIAILIDELIRQRNYNIDVKIFATDVNEACTETASRGIYANDRLKNVSKGRLNNYFVHHEGHYRISAKLRQQVVFARHNVLYDAPFTKLDLVCCRNLLIYFNDDAKKKVLSLFNFSLNPGGIMFLGPSETVSELDDAFVPANEKWRIYRKNAAVRFLDMDMSIGSTEPVAIAPPRLSRSEMQQKELVAVYDALLGSFMPPGILVDEKNIVLHVFGSATDFLSYRTGRPSENILELLPNELSPVVQAGLKRAMVEGKPAVFPGIEATLDSGSVERFNVTVMGVHSRFSPKFLITLELAPDLEIEQTSIASSESLAVLESDGGLITSLRNELDNTRESLHESILNLKSSNEDMQTTNEELIAANEELQSTNEELHSVNEELFTVNTEYQRKITELTELTDDMDNLLDSLRVDTIYLDRRLRVRKFTLGIANIFRLLPQDVGRDFGTFNHELNHDHIKELMQQVLETERAIDEEVEDDRGNWYLMRLLPYSSRGKVDGVLLTLIDITAMKATEQRLSELSEIVQSSHDAIFRVSAEGEIRTWNQGARNLFLHEGEQIVGKKLEVLGLDEQSEGMVATSLEHLRQGILVDRVELKASRRNGEVFDVQSTLSPIYTPDGKLDGASIILRDITAQKKAELQIHEQVDRRDHFLAMLSHELRNPIAAVTNALAIVSKESIESQRLLNAIEIIRQQSGQLGKMLDDLLHVSRVTHNKFKLQLATIDIGQTARQVANAIQHRLEAKGQTLVFEVPEQPVFALVDETRIIQAQTNLLVNACKYTPRGGELKYSLWQEDENIVVEVSDNGDGMSEDLLKRVFEVFVQADQSLDRSAGGMGLGLPLVKMIANAHGGTVTANSPGAKKGSTLRLEIPIGNIEIDVEQNLDTSDITQCLDGIKMLLVEDNDGAREMLAEYLSMEGIDVTTAVDGLEGVEKFQEILPAICVVDIGLPDLNGYEVARRIRAVGQRTLLVALTGYGQEQDQIKVAEAGFDLHFVKPMDPEVLVEKLGREFSQFEFSAEKAKQSDEVAT